MTKVFIDGQFIDENGASLNAVSEAAFYGKGVFTTVACFDGKPFLWEKHWRRLDQNAAVVGIDISGFDEAAIRRSLIETMRRNGLVNGRSRLTFFDTSAAAIWQKNTDKKTSLLINTAAFRDAPEEIKLTVSPHLLNSSSPLIGVKSCNYLENLLALGEATKSGYDEAVRLNERSEITGGCMSNIFWTKGGKLSTPSLLTGCLSGTTREFILENTDCSEVAASVDELNNADSIFLTSAGIGVIRVNVFNGRPLQTTDHAILDLLPRLN